MEKMYNWYRLDNEIGFRNYVDWVIAKCVSNLIVEGKIDPLKCDVKQDYDEFLNNMYELCYPEIITTIWTKVSESVAA